jgi:hypothetical protein
VRVVKCCVHAVKSPRTRCDSCSQDLGLSLSRISVYELQIMAAFAVPRMKPSAHATNILSLARFAKQQASKSQVWIFSREYLLHLTRLHPPNGALCRRVARFQLYWRRERV